MGLFGGSEKKKNARAGYVSPGVAPHSPGSGISIESREYRIFRKRAEVKPTWYEKLAGISSGVLDISFDQKTSKELRAAIDFTGLRIKENAPVSLFILTIIFFSFLGGFMLALRAINMYALLVFVILGLAVGYYLMRYPISLMKSMRIKASSQVVLAILYMVVSMRISPNIERALRFTSSNITGVLAWDMRRLLWDMEMGKFYSSSDALISYISKWKAENEEFSEALRLIMESQKQVPEKAAKTLDEALRVILDGTRDRMKHYAQELQSPVTVIHMMGVVLPILGSVMAPMAAIFLGDPNMALYLFISYDVALPLILIWFIKSTLSKRPVTFSKADVSHHPDLPPPGSFMIRGKKSKVSLPVMPIALVIAIVIMLPSILYFLEHPEYLIVPVDVDPDTGVATPVSVEDPNQQLTLVMSILFTVGAATALGTFFLSTNVQRTRVEDSIYKMESEFELALFQLGNRISGGTPLEIAVEKANQDVKDMEISNLFGITLRNMRTFGMTFEQALMNPQNGALRYYPSSLIQNVMRTITDTAKRGVQFASESMLTVSKYLKNVRETQEYMRTILSETTSSMQFQAYAMAPLVTGLVVAMSNVIMQVLVFLGTRLSEFGVTENLGMNVDVTALFGSTSAITAPLFQIIVGIYLMEVIMILAMFVTEVNRGDDKSMRWYLAGKMILVAIIIYSMVAVGSSMAFGGMIEDALKNVLIT